MTEIKTKNFNPRTDKKLKCTCEHQYCDQRSVKQETLDKVQLIRQDANRPLTITSAGRCSHHPNETHRSKPADHQNCIAVDISISNGLDRMEIVKLGLKHGANAIGVAKTFVHLGWRDTNSTVMWVY